MAAGLAAGALAVGSVLWVTFGNGVKLPVPGYEVDRVVDGDTFYTTDDMRVRLADVNAPEIGRCGSRKATQRLEELILNKQIFIRAKSIDPFNRNDGLVYTNQGLVNLKMLEEGMGVYFPKRQAVPVFKAASEKARKLKKGIYGPKCVQMVNKNHPSCNIKGNISDVDSKKVKYYYSPNCLNYSRTIMELYKGDQWFCTEAEAKKASFAKPKQCL